MADANLAGRVLVATPRIEDPHFERTVVLLLAHGPEGALGVVLNRASDTAAADLVPAWGDRAAPPAVMFVGGPVAPGAVIGLDPDGPVDLNVDPDETDDAPGALRLFAGSAGWGPGQLEGELDDGAWWVVDAEPGDPFTPDPDGLWSGVLRRQAPPLSWFAVFPPDPLVN